MVSRTQPNANNQTTITNTGPSTTTTIGNSTTTGNSSSRGGSTSTQSYDIRNMTSGALKALDELIAGLSGGKGNAASNRADQLREQWLQQLNAANQLRADYSKSAAFTDSEGAANAALADALEQSMPVISAGIDAAGTSGGSLSALLTQQAAEDAARTAASLRLDAAISYGQISADALRTGAGLVQSGDPVMNSLLEALGIAKGAVQRGSVTTNESNWQNSQSSQTTNSTQVTNNSGQTTTTNTTTNPTQGRPATPATPTPAPARNYSGSGQAWITPSSYRNQNYQTSSNSYSQFGN